MFNAQEIVYNNEKYLIKLKNLIDRRENLINKKKIIVKSN